MFALHMTRQTKRGHKRFVPPLISLNLSLASCFSSCRPDGGKQHLLLSGSRHGDAISDSHHANRRNARRSVAIYNVRHGMQGIAYIYGSLSATVVADNVVAVRKVSRHSHSRVRHEDTRNKRRLRISPSFAGDQSFGETPSQSVPPDGSLYDNVTRFTLSCWI